MHKKSLIVLSIVLLLFTSCSTFSPFYKNREYTTFPCVFGKENELLLFVSLKDSNLKNLLKEKLNGLEDFVDRSDYLTLAFPQDGTIMGAFEGYFPIDSVRLATGKNTSQYGDFYMFSPDGGIIAFTNASIENAKERMFENRENILDENKAKVLSKHSFSILGCGDNLNTEQISDILGIDKTYMNFNKIDISFDFDNSSLKVDDNITFLLNGKINYKTENDAKKFSTAIKGRAVSVYRKNALPFSIKDFDAKLTESGSSLEFYSFPLFLTYSP